MSYTSLCTPGVRLAIGVALLATSAAAQSPAAQLDDWREQHGDNWRTVTNQLTGTVEMLYGGRALPGFEPDTNVEADWFRLGRGWIEATRQMHGVELKDVVADRFVFLPMGQATSTDKITVSFEQIVDGIPVEDGRINALFDTRGALLSLHTTGASEVEGRGQRPAFDAGFASLIARERFTASEGVEPNHYSAPTLVWAHVDDQETRRWTLAWQVEAQWIEEGFEPAGFEYTIDAQSRQILKRETTIHYFDVTGTVMSNASPGSTADHPGNPPAPLPVPHVRVNSSAGTVFTDADGNFTIAGVNTPVSITLQYRGRFTNVTNNAGGNYSVTLPNVQANQANTLLMNPTPSEHLTAQANGFRSVGTQRDWIRSVIPGDATADFLSQTNVSQPNNCNAFYNGSSTNYFRRGGGCNNTAFSVIVAHEMGHWLNQRYSTGNGGDGMGEGNADVFANYQYDDPVLGRFFGTNGGGTRTATNNRQYCGDGNGGCYGEVHRDGEVWMGAAWKVRTRLNTSLGGALGDLTSDLLFLGWMNAYNQRSIHSIIEIQWLTLDDNDGNINNGTPNYAEIDAGFKQQGFPGFALEYVAFANVLDLPNTTNESGPYVVTANMNAALNPPLASASLVYRVDGGAAQTVPMAGTGGNGYSGSIPGHISPSFIEYYVQGVDSQGNTGEFPSDDLEAGLNFYVGQVTTLLSTDFESGAAGWSNGGGPATTGRWELGDPQGTAAQSEDDHTAAPGVNCWVTGRASGGSLGANDIDGGETILLSPIFDAAGLTNIEASYWRWYSNNQGGSPNADIFIVEVSNDGGSSWSNVETVGPAGVQSNGGWFRHVATLDSILTPTASMRLRFRASDLGTGSIVEAALDDVRIQSVASNLAPPQTYCSTNLNSTGFHGQIAFSGSQRIGDNQAELTGQSFPAGAFGLFFFGSLQTQSPISGQQGNLCVSGTVHRLPVIQTDTFFGTVGYSLDFTDPGTNARFITASSTWNFQFWHRDSFQGAATSNTSNGLEVEFGG